MPLSARNRLGGTVQSVRTDGLMAEVVIELGDGQTVTSTITAASVDRLGIEEGDDVAAVIKATEVMVETDDE
jgi:molybdopterin-binding protein